MRWARALLYGLRLTKAILEFVIAPFGKARFLPPILLLGMLPAHEPH
jgi:hypothetical protein